MLSAKNATSLANWLLQDQPGLFVQLAKVARIVPRGTTLGDFTDVLSSIGDSLGDAVSSVGDFLTSAQGLSTLASLGTTYMNTTAQKNALNIQLANAAANKAAAPIQTVYNQATGQYQAVYTTANGQQQVVTSATVPQYYPSGTIGAATAAASNPFQQYLPYIAIGGGVLLLVLFLSSRR